MSYLLIGGWRWTEFDIFFTDSRGSHFWGEIVIRLQSRGDECIVSRRCRRFAELQLFFFLKTKLSRSSWFVTCAGTAKRPESSQLTYIHAHRKTTSIQCKQKKFTKKKRKTWCPKVKNPNWQSRIQRDIRPSDFSGGKCWRNVGQTLGSDGCRLVENKFVAECQSNTTTRAASPACERSKRGRSLLFSGVCRGSANVSV